MTLEQLRVFVAVAERQHMTQAARALNLAQSAASAAVAALEASHGTRRSHRVGRGLALTEAGRAFLGEARAVLARAEAADLLLAELGGMKRGVLTVQASQTIASYWLPRHLVAFRQAYPGVEIRLSIGNTAQVAAAVHDGMAEIGLIEGAVTDAALEIITVAHDQLVLVVGPEHPWTARSRADAPLDAAELRTTAWVLREPGSGTRSALEVALELRGIAISTLNVALELPSNEAVRAAVEAGLGATALSASVAAPSLEVGLLHHVPFDLPQRAFQVLRHRRRSPSRAASALLHRLVNPGGAPA